MLTIQYATAGNIIYFRAFAVWGPSKKMAAFFLVSQTVSFAQSRTRYMDWTYLLDIFETAECVWGDLRHRDLCTRSRSSVIIPSILHLIYVIPTEFLFLVPSNSFKNSIRASRVFTHLDQQHQLGRTCVGDLLFCLYVPCLLVRYLLLNVFHYIAALSLLLFKTIRECESISRPRTKHTNSTF